MWHAVRTDECTTPVLVIRKWPSEMQFWSSTFDYVHRKIWTKKLIYVKMRRHLIILPSDTREWIPAFYRGFNTSMSVKLHSYTPQNDMKSLKKHTHTCTEGAMLWTVRLYTEVEAFLKKNKKKTSELAGFQFSQLKRIKIQGNEVEKGGNIFFISWKLMRFL